MDYNRNARYFTKAGYGKLSTACWLVAAVCIVLVFLRLGWIVYSIAGTIGIAALICGIVCSGISISDKEYDGIVNGMVNHFHKQFSEFVHEKVNQHNGRGKAPVSVDEEKMKFANVYFYDEDALQRVGQDDRRRSNKLALSAYFCDKHTVYIGYELVGISVDLHEDLLGAYAYDNIESIETDQPEPRSPYAEYDRVLLKLKNKEEPLVFYMANDAELGALVDTIRARITE